MATTEATLQEVDDALAKRKAYLDAAELPEPDREFYGDTYVNTRWTAPMPRKKLLCAVLNKTCWVAKRESKEVKL